MFALLLLFTGYMVPPNGLDDVEATEQTLDCADHLIPMVANSSDDTSNIPAQQIPHDRPSYTPRPLARPNEGNRPRAEDGIERTFLEVLPKVVGRVGRLGPAVLRGPRRV